MSYLSFLSLCFNLSSLSAIVLPFLSLIRPFVSFHSALPSFLLLSCAARPFSTLGPILPVLLYTCRAPSCSPVLSFVCHLYSAIVLPFLPSTCSSHASFLFPTSPIVLSCLIFVLGSLLGGALGSVSGGGGGAVSVAEICRKRNFRPEALQGPWH